MVRNQTQGENLSRPLVPEVLFGPLHLKEMSGQSQDADTRVDGYPALQTGSHRRVEFSDKRWGYGAGTSRAGLR